MKKAKCDKCMHGDWMPESSREPWNACDWCINNDCFEPKETEQKEGD